MRQKSIKCLVVLLCLSLAIGLVNLVPSKAYATETVEVVNTYETIESTLAPGVVQTVNSGYGADGLLINYYIAIADINRGDVGVQATYKGAQCEDLGMSKMTEQAAAMYEKHSNANDAENYIPHYAVVAGVNGDGYNTSNGKPSGAHVMNGVSGFGITKAGNSCWFAIFEDGTALCGANNTDWDQAVAAHGPAQEAIGGFQLVRKDGVDIPYTSSSYLNDGRYPRSFVGVTADNRVVLMAVDGNGSGGSAGTNYAESLELMDEVGCTYILCLDGGGSATYISRPEGSNEIQLTSKPSDGSERAVSNGLVIYTSTPPSDVFEKASITANDYYITPGSTTEAFAIGVSPAGTSAEIPENAIWSCTLGTINSEGVFTSDGTVGDAVISMLVDGEVVGETTIHVVNPDKIAFNQRAMVVPFGQSARLAITANYGLNKVKYNWEDLIITFSDESIGSVSDGVFTAASSGTQSDVTVALKANPNVKDTITLKLGKGSEVIFDFEKGTESADLSNWQVKDHEGKYPIWAEASIVDRENGMVHSGEHAMAFHMPMDEYIHGSEFYFAQSLTWIGDRIELKNALSIGFWIYIPEEATNTEIAVNYIYYDAQGKQQRTTPDACLNNDFDDMAYSGWHYLSVPVTKELAYIEDGAEVAASQGYKRNFFLKFYVTNADAFGESSYMGDITYYIDDVTIDYSEAVDDREAPIFTDVRYAYEGIFDAISLNGQTVQNNTLTFAAFVDENTEKSNYSGLDTQSIKAFIDGVEVAYKYVDGVISIEDAVLDNGTHVVTFEICDVKGNYSQISREITVKANNSDPVVKVVPKDVNKNIAYTDSVYWVDVVAQNVETIKSIELKLDLDTMHTWEIDQIVKLYGFELTTKYATYADKVDNALTFILTRTDDVEASGTHVIMSIPVRVWSFVTDCGGTSKDPATGWKNSDVTAVSVNISTEKGIVTYLNDTSISFSSEKISVDTEAYTFYDDMISTDEGKKYWENNTYHVHNAVAIDDVDATCTTNGYTGRTWCAICESPVEWGTTILATGHNFAAVDGVLKCECGKTFSGIYTDGKTYIDGVVLTGWSNDSYFVDGVNLTGVQFVEGYYYDFGETGICAGQVKFTGLFYDETVSAYRYAKLGELVGGWVKIGDYWHYFNTSTKVAVTGVKNWNAVFTFDETGMTKGAWLKTDEGVRYYYGPEYYRARNHNQVTFVEIDGKTYNFDKSGYITTGIHALYDDWAYMTRGEMRVWEFDDEGALIGRITTKGVIDNKRGGLYLVEDDGFVHGGSANGHLAYYNGGYYFVLFSGKLLTNASRWIGESQTNSLLPAGTYSFGADGKMEVPFTGVKASDEGVLCYYKDGKIVNGVYNSELVEIEGSIYLVKWSGKVAVNETRFIPASKTNGLLSAGTYEFGEDGKLFTGIKENAEGVLCYYKDGKIVNGVYNSELVEIEGSIYLVKWSGKVAVNETRFIPASKTNGLLPAGNYSFGADGKLQK